MEVVMVERPRRLARGRAIMDNLRRHRGKIIRQLIGSAGAKLVCTAIGELLGAFTKNQCANYSKNSGHAPTKCIPL
jgi:transposase